MSFLFCHCFIRGICWFPGGYYMFSRGIPVKPYICRWHPAKQGTLPTVDRPLHIEDSKEGRCFHWYFDISRSCWNREGHDLLYRWSGGVAYVACFWKVFCKKGGLFWEKGWKVLFCDVGWCYSILIFSMSILGDQKNRKQVQNILCVHILYIHIIIILYIIYLKYMYRKVSFAWDCWNLPGNSTFFSYFSSWVTELKHSIGNWLTQHISCQEQENPSEQGRKSARLLNTSLCSLNRLLRKLQVLLVIVGPGLNLEVCRSFFLSFQKGEGWEFSGRWHVLLIRKLEVKLFHFSQIRRFTK